MQLREQMLDIMVNTIKTVPATTAHGVQVTARALAAVVQTGDELSPSAQVRHSQSHSHTSVIIRFDVKELRAGRLCKAL